MAAQLSRSNNVCEDPNAQHALLTVPVSRAEAKEAAAATRVLLVEDDEDDQRLVHEYLRAAGTREFSVERVESLATALDQLAKGGIEAVLLDLFLPDSEGFETFIQVHAQFPNAPVVILTGVGNQELAVRAMSAGAQDYLYKNSLSPEVLVRALRYAVERKQAEQRLRQAQKMEALGHLAGGIAHDFNNLLGIILGNAEILQDCALKGDVPPRAVQRIREAARSAVALIDQLLTFSRGQSLKPAVLNPNDVVEQSVRLLRELIRESIALSVHMDPDAGYIRADRVQMEQVILNLAVNARDAMPRGGTLAIETTNVDIHDGRFVGYGPVDPGRYIMLTVKDTGTGMNAETQAHMFEPFYTTKERGTGLGLATVGGVVAQMGGYISVHSEVGRGTTIRVLFPRIEDPVAAAASQSRVSEDTSGSETILLVEDSIALREVAREFLSAGGYTVLEAGSSAEALTKAQRHQGAIDLLLTDVVLPSGSGREVAMELKRLRPQTAVLYMSGYTASVVADHQEPDATPVLLQKPFTKKQLLNVVREMLDEQKMRRAAS